MMKSLLLTLAVTLCAATTFAQGGGSIGIYSDPQGWNCNLESTVTGIVPGTAQPGGNFDNVPAGVTPYYIVHYNALGATSCGFAAKVPQCLAAQLVSEDSPFSNVTGSSQSFVHVDYGMCLSWAIHVYTLYFLPTGQTPPCCYFMITAGTSPSGQIEAGNCDSPPRVVSAQGHPGVVNADPTCQCFVPIESWTTTWGMVKALYTE
jgi:hypothetical protein